ncbi:MAG: glycosyltransferase [Melioribacteraceae bacterium]|nr:glycosyltransferase [Melioribacteraceae bacterium]
MRILIYLNGFGATTTTFIYNQAKVLQMNHEVAIVCASYLKSDQFIFNPIYIIPYKPNVWVKRLRRRLCRYNIKLNFHEYGFSRELNKVVSNFNPDIIHCQFGPDALKFIDNLSYRKKDIPIFIQFRGYDASMMLKSSPVYVRRWRRLVRRKNILPIFVADYLFKEFIAYGIVPDKRRILYSCTDLSKFRRLSHPSDFPKVFLQVSSFVEKKGHAYTVEAFHRFAIANPDVDWQLVLAGDGPLRLMVMEKVAQLGLSQRIIFPGRLTHEESRNWMEQAHYFVHHSITTASGDAEGIPNAIMEAMAMELPVITTYHAGIPELVDDGVHGFLVEERDIDSYARCLAVVLEWSYLPVSREKVKAQFELYRHRDVLMEFYKEALSSEK